MTQADKDVYSLIFKFALSLTKLDKDSVTRIVLAPTMNENGAIKDSMRLIRGMTIAALNGANTDTFTWCWNILKEYADITNTKSDEERWRELIDKVNEYGEKFKDGNRTMGADILAEIEGRARSEQDNNR